MTEEDRDGTLDSFVAAWAAPPPGSQFHSRVRRAFDREFVKVPWWRRGNDVVVWRVGTSLWGGAAIGAFFIVTIGLPFPQTVPFRLPWLQPSLTMDSEEIRYSDDGRQTFDMYYRTVPMEGHDMVLWKYFPDHPYDHILEGIRTQASYLLYRIMLPFLENTEEKNVRTHSEQRVFPVPRASVKTGCLRGDNTILGHETVLGEERLLGYSTTVVQFTQRNLRWTAWLAPSLGCQELKGTIEGLGSDGSYHLWRETRVLDVTP